MCSPDGCVFDIVNAVPYLQKFHRHPVSGEPLEVKDLIQLQFHKNADGEYHCPVLNKVFTEHTHIVAVKTSGHVYCHEVCMHSMPQCSPHICAAAMVLLGYQDSFQICWES